MYKLILENSKGEQLQLTQNEDKYSITSITGLTPPSAEITQVDNIGDGAEITHERTGTRNIVIDMNIVGKVEENRINLYKYIKNGKYIKVYFENKTRNVWIDGRVEHLDVDQFQNTTTCQISILCPDVWWKDVEEAINSINTIKSNLYFPFYTLTPIPFSEYSTIQILNLINKGDIDSGMTINVRAKGEITNLKIFNRETREFIGLGTDDSPYVLQAGDEVIITTHPNNKKIKLIRNATEYNIFNYLTPNSTFLQMGAGDNVFTYSASDGNEYIDITFKHYSQYEGV